MGRSKKTTYGGRAPMPLSDRAKIFSPFDPLDGFRAALRAKELEIEHRVDRLNGQSGTSVQHERLH